MLENVKEFGAWVLALAVAVVGFFVRREIRRADEHDERLRRLETVVISRDDFDELRSSLVAQIAHAADRAEERLDRIYEMLSRNDQR